MCVLGRKGVGFTNSFEIHIRHILSGHQPYIGVCVCVCVAWAAWADPPGPPNHHQHHTLAERNKYQKSTERVWPHIKHNVYIENKHIYTKQLREWNVSIIAIALAGDWRLATSEYHDIRYSIHTQLYICHVCLWKANLCWRRTMDARTMFERGGTLFMNV